MEFVRSSEPRGNLILCSGGEVAEWDENPFELINTTMNFSSSSDGFEFQIRREPKLKIAP